MVSYSSFQGLHFTIYVLCIDLSQLACRFSIDRSSSKIDDHTFSLDLSYLVM